MENCTRCQSPLPVPPHTGAAGYGVLNGQKICYQCCADDDKARMIENGKIALYLTTGEKGTWKGWRITNWPGTLTFSVQYHRTGKHNIARVRYDVWFTGPDNRPWHGVTYGDNTQICHCKRIKK